MHLQEEHGFLIYIKREIAKATVLGFTCIPFLLKNKKECTVKSVFPNPAQKSQSKRDDFSQLFEQVTFKFLK